MSKEAILERYRDDSKFPNMNTVVFFRSDALEAMEEYAKQKAVEFASWYANSRWSSNLTYDASGKLEEQKTMEEVYEIFTQTQNQ